MPASLIERRHGEPSPLGSRSDKAVRADHAPGNEVAPHFIGVSLMSVHHTGMGEEKDTQGKGGLLVSPWLHQVEHKQAPHRFNVSAGSISNYRQGVSRTLVFLVAFHLYRL